MKLSKPTEADAEWAEHLADHSHSCHLLIGRVGKKKVAISVMTPLGADDLIETARGELLQAFK